MLEVHPDLVAVAHYALELSAIDFGIIDGMRSLAEQRAHVEAGRSKTMASRHLTGHALDAAPWLDGVFKFEFENRQQYKIMALAWKLAAARLGIPLEWGGDWDWFDGAHFQLPHAEYPP